jgi:hypothetical protein
MEDRSWLWQVEFALKDAENPGTRLRRFRCGGSSPTQAAVALTRRLINHLITSASGLHVTGHVVVHPD